MRWKSISLLVLIGMLFTGIGTAETVQFEDSWGDDGFNLVSQSPTGLELVFSLSRMELGQIDYKGETFTTVGIPGVILPNNAGAPDLPGMGRYFAVPQGADVSFELVDYRTVTREGIVVCPAAPIQIEGDDTPPAYERDPAIYGSDAFYPAAPVLLSGITQMRGVDVAIVGITPFGYNPVSRQLVVYTDLRVKVTFRGGNGRFGDTAYRSRWFEPMLRQQLLNYPTLPIVDFDTKQAKSRGEECEYMIFSPDDPDFLDWAETIKDFRVKQGIATNVFNIADLGGTANGIDSKIVDAYNNWTLKPVAALMLGDRSQIPANSVSGYFGPVLSDNLYADVTGNTLPDINVARITANNASELALTIGKFMDYEMNPPLNASFYANPIMAGGWQTERWFILCTEVIFGFLTNEQGKSPVREYAIYSGSPGSVWSTATNTSTVVNYFGPNGLGYIPATPGHLTDWGGNATRINNDINSGAFYMLHRDHGYEEGWGEPSYNIGSLSGLSNDDLCFVMSINCLTGKYDYSPQCFAEAFHRMQHGALGVIAASEVSYSFVNDTFVWGMHDSMWPNFDPGYGGSTGDNMLMPGFAQASGKWYLAASSWPYNNGDKTITYHLFHMHGDAFTRICDEVPQALSVQHAGSLSSQATTFDVLADAGCLVAVAFDGRVLGTAIGTGSVQSIPIDPPGYPGIVYVTGTMLNHSRYEGQAVVQSGLPLDIWLPDGEPDPVLPGEPAEVTACILGGTENYVPGSGTVHFRFDPADPFDTVSLTDLGSDLYGALVPGVRPDSVPQFYVSAQGDGGSTVTCPINAPTETFTFGIEGIPEILLHDNFETDMGWTVEDVNVSTGTWERCDPNPTSGGQVAPVDDNPAGTGTLCFVTENGPVNGTYSDYDIDGGPTRLISPTIDLSDGDAVISCYYWFYGRDGDDPFQIQISNNNGTSWTTVLNTYASNSAWGYYDFNVADHVTPTAQVKVRFNAQDQPNNSITEAGLDDFEVSRINYSASIWVDSYTLNASGGDVNIFLDAGATFAGREYAVLGSVSGSYPGTTLPSGKVLPINFDQVSSIIMNNFNSPMFQNFRDYLDNDGESVATLSIGTVPPQYVGMTLTLAFTLTGTFDFVSNPVNVELVP